MSENNEKKDIPVTDESEPIESIEKTVEDLKKKIEELSEEQETEENEDSADTAAKIDGIKENAKEAVSASIEDLKDKATRVANSEEMQKTVSYIKENAMKAVTGAKDKIEEIRKDPKTAETTDKAVKAIKNIAGTVNNKAQQASDYIYDHMDEGTRENLASAYDNAEKAISEGSRKVAQGVNDFYNRPDVQETVGKAKETASRWLNKGSDTLKDILNKKNKE